MNRPFASSVLSRLLVLLFLGGLAYFPIVHADFIWDDDMYLTKNPIVQQSGGLKAIWLEPGATPQYYPLVFTTFYLEHALWGLNPAGYHVVNVVLHLLNAFLLWLLLKPFDEKAAWFAAVLFTVHPVHVETVAWITERKNVLSGLFYLLSLKFFLDFHQDNARRLYWASFACFLLALLSKTVTCSLPVAALILLWWRHGTLSKRDILMTIPFFLIGALLGLATVAMETHVVQAQGEIWGHSLLERSLLAGRILWFYLWKLAWPANLAFFYERWDINAGAAVSYLFPLSFFTLLGAALVYAKRGGRGPAAALLFFAATLFPALGFFNVYPMQYSFVADHFQYLASIGPLALFSFCVVRFWQTKRAGILHNILKPALGILVIALTISARTRCHAFHNVEALWRDTLSKNPSSEIAHNNLAVLLLDRGDAQEALLHFDTAYSLNDQYTKSRVGRGMALSKLGRHNEAAEDFRHITRQIPHWAEPHDFLSRELFQLGKYDEAFREAQFALRLNPELSGAHLIYVKSLLKLGQKGKAKFHAAIGMKQWPALAENYRQLKLE